MKSIYEFFIYIFGLKKCRKDHFFHDWVYEEVVDEKMVGTGNYIEGKEIERKEKYVSQEKYCKRCRTHSMKDPLRAAV